MALTRLDTLRQQSSLSDQEELHGTFYCVHTQPKFGATFLQGWLYVFDSAIVFDANLLAINKVQCIIAYQNVRVIRKRTLLRINNTIAVEWEDSAGACHYDIFTSFMFGSRGKAFDAMMEQWSRACSQASMPSSSPPDSSGGSSSYVEVCSAIGGGINSTSTNSGWSHLLTSLRQRQSTAYEPGTAVVDAAAEAVEPTAADEAVAVGAVGQPNTQEQQEPIIQCSTPEAFKPQGTPAEATCQPLSLSASEQSPQQQWGHQQLQPCQSLQWSDCSSMPAGSGSPTATAAVEAGDFSVGIKRLLGSVKAVSCVALRTLCNTIIMCKCARHRVAAAPRCRTEHSASQVPGWITVVLCMQLMLLWYLLLAMHRVVRLQEQTMLLSMQDCWRHGS